MKKEKEVVRRIKKIRKHIERLHDLASGTEERDGLSDLARRALGVQDLMLGEEEEEESGSSEPNLDNSYLEGLRDAIEDSVANLRSLLEDCGEEDPGSVEFLERAAKEIDAVVERLEG